jgi:hypothetical protein
MSEIHKAMANILAKVDCIEKGRTNQHQGFKFRGIDDALNTLHNIFAEEKVFLLHEVLEHSVTERSTAKGGVSFHHIVKVMFRFVAVDGSDVSAVGIGEASDTGDKGAGKAMSYALKVCLLQTFLIPTEEEKDPDASTTTWGQKQSVKDINTEMVKRGAIQVPAAAAKAAQHFKQAVAFESRQDKAQHEREVIQTAEARMREEAKPEAPKPDVFEQDCFRYERDRELVVKAAKELGITNQSLKAHKDELQKCLEGFATNQYASILECVKNYFANTGDKQ